MTIELDQEVYDQASELFQSLGTTIEDMTVAFLKFCVMPKNLPLLKAYLGIENTMYVLGDVVDRYPDGIKILRRIMKMPNAKMLMGNHEYMMLQAIGHCRNAADERENTNWKQRRHWYQNGGRVTHEQLKHIRLDARAEIFRFIRQLPVNMEVTVNGIKYKLVHASPVENYMTSYWCSRDYKDQREFAVWERWSKTKPIPEGYMLIFGHTPTSQWKRF